MAESVESKRTTHAKCNNHSNLLVEETEMNKTNTPKAKSLKKIMELPSVTPKLSSNHTHGDERIDSLNKQFTVDDIMEMIDENLKQRDKERTFFPAESEARSATRFLSTLSKLPATLKKQLIDIYDEKIKNSPVPENQDVQDFLREAKIATKSKEEVSKKDDKDPRIKIKDKELLKEVKKTCVCEEQSQVKSKLESEKELIKRNLFGMLPAKPKLARAKELKIEEICRNTFNLLKFQRTHSTTYMHDILPFLKAICKEYTSKQVSSITAHEILLLDQINYNVEYYHEISNTEKLYKETLLDGHIFLSRHITKLLESYLANRNSTSKDKFKEYCGNFILLMDTALERIYEIDLVRNMKAENLQICEEVLEIVKEILCTGYSIALVCDQYDSKVIKGSSKTVLNNLEEIRTEISSMKSESMCNLMIDSFCDNLCALERKVNTAVLRVTVGTFTRYEDKINDLFFECTDYLTEKQKECIDRCIGDVDNEIDRLMQIGWFAISCCGYSKDSRNLRNALAKIEALEDELVPGLVTMKKRANETYMEIVLIRMLEAIKELRNSLYHIMDPHAFCSVVENEIETTIVNFKDLIGKGLLCYADHNRKVMKYFLMFEDMINYSENADGQRFNAFQLKSILVAKENVKSVLKEIQARLNQLIVKPDDLDLELKILKRYKVLRHEITKIRKFAYCHNSKEDVAENKHKLDTQDAEININKSTNVSVNLLQERARNIVKNRSIIANTPMKNTSLKILKFTGKSNVTPLLKLAERRKTATYFSSFYNETHLNEPLEITTVLNDICNQSRL